MKLVITGRPISKKRAYLKSKNGGLYLSESFKEWESSAVAQLLEQKHKKVSGYCHIEYEFFIFGKYHVDLDNLIVSVNDVLQAAGIITNDDLIDSIEARKFGGCQGWSTKIEVEEYKELAN